MNILDKIEKVINEKVSNEDFNKSQMKKQVKQIVKQLLKVQNEIASVALIAAKWDTSKSGTSKVYKDLRIQKRQVYERTGEIQTIINTLVKDLNKL